MGMFRFLKLYKETFLVALLCIIAVILYMLGIQIIIPTIILLMALGFLIDERARLMLDEQTSYVYGGKKVRNVDYLIIGDMVDLSDVYGKGKKVVSIMAPNRSLECSFWVLKRMFSLLDEKSGKVIIAVKENNIKKRGITLFEYSFLSPIYRNILEVHYLEKHRKYPFFYSPIKSFKMVCGIGVKRKSDKVDCLDNNIENFCLERGLNVEFRLIK